MLVNEKWLNKKQKHINHILTYNYANIYDVRVCVLMWKRNERWESTSVLFEEESLVVYTVVCKIKSFV